MHRYRYRYRYIYESIVCLAVLFLGQALRDMYSSKSKIIDKVYNKKVQRGLGMRAIATNPESKALYPHSFDGPSVARWIEDLHCGLVGVDMDAAWRAKRFKGSVWLQALTDSYSKLGMTDDYEQLREMLPMLRSFALGYGSALKLRPCEQDYHVVAEHLPKYAVEKALLWPGSLTWYDNHALYHLPGMMERWGSLGLISQEGMEGWQKVLNEILRMSNGFANAGRIPEAIKRMGEAAVAKYMEERKADMPSSAKWVFQQTLLQKYHDLSDCFDACADLKACGRVYEWPIFCLLWERYMVMSKVLLRALSRFRLRRARATGSTYYTQLLEHYHEYWKVQADYTADDLSEHQKRLQSRKARRSYYESTKHQTQMQRIGAAPTHAQPSSYAYCSAHPAEFVAKGTWLGTDASQRAASVYPDLG